MDIPNKVKHFSPSLVIDNAPFRGASETALSRNVAGYALRCCGNVAHYNFPTLGSAPSVSVSAVNGWSSFSHVGEDSCTFDVPWHHQSQFASIKAIIRVISMSRIVARVRLQSDDLIDAVASTEGQDAILWNAGESSFLAWRTTTYLFGAQYKGELWTVYQSSVKLESPTVPANRRISLKPQIYISGLADVITGIAGDPTFYLESMMLRDETDRDIHG